MTKRKLREWEIPMNLSQEEKKEFNMTTLDQLNWSAKKNVKIVASYNFISYI